MSATYRTYLLIAGLIPRVGAEECIHLPSYLVRPYIETGRVVRSRQAYLLPASGTIPPSGVVMEWEDSAKFIQDAFHSKDDM